MMRYYNQDLTKHKTVVERMKLATPKDVDSLSVTVEWAIQRPGFHQQRPGREHPPHRRNGEVIHGSRPYRADRVRGMVGHGDFIEIFCNAAIEVCEARDVKGMYKKARAGQIAEFTGISSPYEVPENPELTVKTGETVLEECVQQVLGEMMQRELIKSTS